MITSSVNVVTHPLVQHKLSLMREKDRSIKGFRELLKEIGMLICYEVTRDLPLAEVEIETPLVRSRQPKIAGKKLVFAPVLRAGMTFVEGMLDLVSPTSASTATRRHSLPSSTSSRRRPISASAASSSSPR